MKAILLFSISLMAQNAFSYEVRVSGFTRANGTQVKSYSRTSPDSSRANNYGKPSSYTNTWEVSHPELRDYDHDGITNMNDADDDNDGVSDDNENY